MEGSWDWLGSRGGGKNLLIVNFNMDKQEKELFLQ